MAAVEQLAADALTNVVARVFAAVGVASEAAEWVARDLVAADVEGVASHGVMLVPMYVRRIQAGSVSTASSGVVISDRKTAIVIDAGNALGQLTARQAVDLATSRAAEFGMAAVAVRNAFHFGTAGRHARAMAERGCVGVVMSNTRPLMPPPGGAQPLTGNNPIAVAVPGDGPFVPEVDMALSAAAMGKIRNAAAAGAAIPKGWATDRHGADTTDPKAAIEGMLLPAAGPKGFGLAFMIDLLCGGLSGGGIGAQVRPLFDGLDEPYNCSNLFLAIDVGHFGDERIFRERSREALERTSAVSRAPGVERVFAPGELAYVARAGSGGTCGIAPPTIDALTQTARSLGIDASELTMRTTT